MGFKGLKRADGNFDPVLKYNAKAGRFFRVDKTETGNEDVDVSEGLSFIPDWVNHEFGWSYFDGNQPDFHFQHHDLGFPPCPGDNHKQSVRLRVRLCLGAGGDIREFMAVSAILLRVLDDLDTEIRRSDEYQSGKLPVVAFKGTTPIKTKHGTNYAPNLVITGWVDRSEFDGGMSAPEVDLPPPPMPSAA